MKILDLHLLAYGPFTDTHLDLSGGSEGLHIIFGPNEAGKSSALRALRALLYGVPERTGDDFIHDRTDLRVGGMLRGVDGGELQCYRRKGRKDTLLDANGNPVEEDRLTRLLGGVAEPLFERLFGIDHEALVSGGQALLAERGREAEALFGTGLGSTAIHTFLEALDRETQSLFAPRASKPLINAGISRLKEIEARQRDVSLTARHWDDARKAMRNAVRQLEEIDTQLADAGKRRSALERIRRTMPGLARRAQLQEQLANIGDVPTLDENFGSRREDAVSKRRIAAESRSKALTRLEGLRQDASGLEVSEDLLAEVEAIDELRERLGGYRKAARDKPGLVARRETLLEQARQRFAEIRPDLSKEDFESLRPLLARRRRTTELGGRQEARESGVRQARKNQADAEGKLAASRELLGQLPAPIDYDGLQKAVDEARRAGDVDSAIEEATANLVRHQQTCEDELSALGLWDGGVSDLVTAPLPGAETIRSFSESCQSIEDEVRQLEKTCAEAGKEAQQIEVSLEALRLAGAVPTEAELHDARQHRDLGWRLLRRHWVDGEDVKSESEQYAQGRALHDAFEGEVIAADEISDRLRRESRRVHDQASGQAKLEDCRKRATEAEAALAAIAHRRQELDQSWQDVWSPCGIAPFLPREMANWLDRALRLRERAAQGTDLHNRVDDLKRVRDTQRRNLASALAVCGEPQEEPREIEQLRVILDHAESRLRAIEKTERRRVSLQEETVELEESVRRLAGMAGSAEAELTAWTSEWAALMLELGREERSTPGEVSDYLEAIAAALKLNGEARELQLRIAGIDEEAQAFKRDAEKLVERLAPELKDLSANDTAVQLSAHLDTERQAKSRLDELEKQSRQAESEVRETEAIIGAADEALEELCRQANCNGPDELQAVEKRFNEKLQLTQQLREVESELVEGGDGLGISALQDEVDQVDRDSVVSELNALMQQIEHELRPAREIQLEVKISAEREFEAMAGGSAASELAEEAQQTLAELRGHADRYARLKLASRLLRDEIERFRRQHRDPILTRASAFYKTLTCGSLVAIETDFDESDKPVLVGVRPNGRRLRVEAMSTGTRDQLYLALRLATLDHYIDSSEPLPFVVDDILIQFDDYRARATLGALAGFSSRTQVILFTHHRRVVDEAVGLENASGRVYVHELTTSQD